MGNDRPSLKIRCCKAEFIDEGLRRERARRNPATAAVTLPIAESGEATARHLHVRRSNVVKAWSGLPHLGEFKRFQRSPFELERIYALVAWLRVGPKQALNGSRVGAP